MKRVSNMEGNKNLSWLCINKYLPELDINNIKETLLKSGVTFFNLHRMEKGYFPTNLIKFQVDTNKTDISYLTNKTLRCGTANISSENLPRNRAKNTASLNRTHQRATGKKKIPQKKLT